MFEPTLLKHGFRDFYILLVESFRDFYILLIEMLLFFRARHQTKTLNVDMSGWNFYIFDDF